MSYLVIFAKEVNCVSAKFNKIIKCSSYLKKKTFKTKGCISRKFKKNYLNWLGYNEISKIKWLRNYKRKSSASYE